MTLDPEACWQALAAKDRRFDGRFFVGVSSTRIYCRPVCSARTPKRENCTFYEAAAQAEAAGYRPCLICRPELAPGRNRMTSKSNLAAAAYRMIEEGGLDDQSLPVLAEKLGVTDRHLRRALTDEFGVGPIEIAQTQRLLTAKRLLTDSSMPIGEVALASGFSSLRRFNALFLDRYRMKPSDLRRRPREQSDQAALFSLSYRPPFDWESLMAFLADRAIQGVESVVQGVYRRTVHLKGRSGWIECSHRPEKCAVSVRISTSLLPVAPRILNRVKRLFDLGFDPSGPEEILGQMMEGRAGLRLPGGWDGFEVAVRAILGQQVTVRSATLVSGRVAQRFGTPIETPFPELVMLAPSPETLAGASLSDLGECGVVRSRGAAISELTRKVLDGTLDFGPAASSSELQQGLRAIKGIGEWTASYIAMRALGDPDIFLATDAAVLKAAGRPCPKELALQAQQWSPWRSYAVLHLWKSLETSA